MNANLDSSTKIALRTSEAAIDAAKAIIPMLDTKNIGIWVKTTNQYRVLFNIHHNNSGDIVANYVIGSAVDGNLLRVDLLESEVDGQKLDSNKAQESDRSINIIINEGGSEPGVINSPTSDLSFPRDIIVYPGDSLRQGKVIIGPVYTIDSLNNSSGGGNLTIRRN